MKKADRPSQKTDFDPERHHKQMEKRERHRKVMAERKKFKRNQQPRGPRRKDWVQNGEPDDEGNATFERIMPLDEGERRRGLERLAFGSVETQTPAEERQVVPSFNQDGLLMGRVIGIASGLCRVAIGDEVLLCSGRGALYAQETGYTNAVATGDQVLVRQDRAGSGVVEHVLPRHSLLARPDVFHPHLQQVVVANVDQLLIVASWREPIIWFELIDRYLVAAARHQLPAVICVNKIDLADSRAECEEALRLYEALGVPCVFASAQTGDGIEALAAVLRGRISVLAGLSGVGKSSLLAAVQPGLQLRVGQVSVHSGEGRHTTTQATMLQLDGETWVVDTPGIREFGVSGLTRSQLILYFAELAEAANRCRFRNCTHGDEPGCAVLTAAARGEIAPSRLHSYRLIYESLSA
jgi:ribosome biogenesis GTPase